MINENKKQIREQRYKERQSKPLTRGEQREYMIRYGKNQGNNWSMVQLKRLSHDKLQVEFEKCIRQNQLFTPMDSELEKERFKIPGEPLQLEEAKKSKVVNVEEVVDVAGPKVVKKEEESGVKKPIIRWTRKKKTAKKGLNKSSPTKSDVEDYMEERVEEPS